LLQPRRVGVVCAISEPFAVNGFFWSIEQREVDRVAHLAVPAVAGVQPIAAIVDRPHLCRDLAVEKRSIEVGDAIESAEPDFGPCEVAAEAGNSLRYPSEALYGARL
jgi:hypothetical protein